MVNNKKIISIAIDGPAAAGKSTIAKLVSKQLNYTYIDTGAMYRAVTLYCLKHGINCQNEPEVIAVLPKISIRLKPEHVVMLNNKDVSFDIRTPEVNQNVSYIAAIKEVRLALVEQQRQMASLDSVVMDGRDIGTYVLPNANVKIFMIASVETRAVRRYEENLSKGINLSLEDVIEEVRKRDYIDSHRDFAPLKMANDAVIIDTSFMSIVEVVARVLEIIGEKIKCND
ncbi:MAG: (d)CMP kinase [Erysipelotrichaceae bacterium]|jgi:cytidylate kinase|nr:(d)CMP kinase [Erysipelotrichaceae bacterium]